MLFEPLENFEKFSGMCQEFFEFFLTRFMVLCGGFGISRSLLPSSFLRSTSFRTVVVPLVDSIKRLSSRLCLIVRRYCFIFSIVFLSVAISLLLGFLPCSKRVEYVRKQDVRSI